MVIGVPAGVIAARYHNTATDQVLMVLALLGVSIPNFLLGLLFVLFFSVWLGWFPVAGYSPLEYGWLKTLRSLVLPAFALGLVQSALIARIARSSMLDVLREQFIIAGRAKGLGERAVIYKHAFKNALIPTMTIIGISFAILISGRGGGRDRVQHPRPRPADHLGGAAPRLPGHPGRRAVHRRRVHADQPARRSVLPDLRSARAVPVSGTRPP